MLQVSSHLAGWGIVWAVALHPPWATGARSTAEAEDPATVEPGLAAGRKRMTPRARRTCPGEFYPRGRASWTSSAVNSWADTHPLTTTTISSSSRLVTARGRAIKYSFYCHTRPGEVSQGGHFAHELAGIEHFDLCRQIFPFPNLIFSVNARFFKSI